VDSQNPAGTTCPFGKAGTQVQCQTILLKQQASREGAQKYYQLRTTGSRTDGSFRSGQWVERKDNPPGKIVLTHGLRRIMDMLYTRAFFDRYREKQGALPPRIAAWVGDPPSEEL
jgi:hypothetical protein